MAQQSLNDAKEQYLQLLERELKAAWRAKSRGQMTLPDVLQAAGSAFDSMERVKRLRQGSPRSWPGGRFIEHVVTEALQPFVEEIRRDAFGMSAPLKSRKAWEEWTRRYGYSDDAQGHQELAAYRKACLERSNTVPRTPLESLQDDVREHLVSRTGWDEDFAIEYVALGVWDPRRFLISGRAKYDALPWARVTLYPWHLNETYFQQLRIDLRSMFGRLSLLYLKHGQSGHWGKPYTASDLRLVDLMADIGAPPQSKGRGRDVGRNEYWKRASKALAKRNPRGGQVTPNALRMRWERFAATHPEDMRMLLKDARPQSECDEG